jgi:UDP-2,4-diacetamido-2,4,6-trideoxy-beta-L-altropyranose hydrolase
MVGTGSPFPAHLIIRTDAGAVIGTGHAMRCLALAQAHFDRGGRVTFLMAQGAPSIEGRLKDEGAEVFTVASPPGSEKDAEELARLAADCDAPWVILDGFHFDTGYQKILEQNGLSILLIDDCGRPGMVRADLLLNQNIAAREDLYPLRKPEARLLLGTGYILLRREFLRWREWKRAFPDVARKILVTFGGSDPVNATCKVLEALSRLPVEGLEVCVVIGPQNMYAESIRNAAADFPICIKVVSESRDMASLMAWADFAVSSGGSTCWELAFMGVPSLIASIAENQDETVAILHAAGKAEAFSLRNGTTGDLADRILNIIRSREHRMDLSRQIQEGLDGGGAMKVLTAMGDATLFLRPAEFADMRLVWKWRNEPYARSVSFHRDPIPLGDHRDWFSERLRDPESRIFIGTTKDGIPAGVIRFSLQREDAEVSVVLDPLYRGKGLGRNLIRAGVQRLFRTAGVMRIHSYIKTENEISIRAFLSAGFRAAGTVIIGGEEALHLVRSRNDLS